MEERQVRNLVKAWHQRARAERDLISKFVFLRFCFNAWLAYESNEDTDREMIDWLKGRGGGRLPAAIQLRHRRERRNEPVPRLLKTLVGLSPISSTGRRQREVRIDSPDDFSGIVEGVYQVRCNLFHGGKQPSDARDQKLVAVCARILEKWVGNLVGSWRSASSGPHRRLERQTLP